MRIAIVKLSALGDIVHAMVVLQFIKNFNKEISIDWIVEESYKDLLDSHPDINKVHLINIKQAKDNKSLPALISEIKKVRKLSPYDLVVDMQGLLKSALISRIIPSKVTLGFDKYSSRESISSFFYNQTFNYDYKKNIIERNLAIIKFALGIKSNINIVEKKVPFLYSSRDYLVKDFSAAKKNIIFVLGASYKSKCYPVKNLAELTKLFDANYIAIWGDANERKMADELKYLSPAVNICEKLSIDSIITLISKADLLIGPDTGPTHMAWALDIPSITIFGPTPGFRNTLETKINKIIESDSIVDSKKINKNDDSIKNIKVNDIFKIVCSLLN
jgi:heptosyltransferase I